MVGPFEGFVDGIHVEGENEGDEDGVMVVGEFEGALVEGLDVRGDVLG